MTGADDGTRTRDPHLGKVMGTVRTLRALRLSVRSSVRSVHSVESAALRLSLFNALRAIPFVTVTTVCCGRGPAGRRRRRPPHMGRIRGLVPGRGIVRASSSGCAGGTASCARAVVRPVRGGPAEAWVVGLRRSRQAHFGHRRNPVCRYPYSADAVVRRRLARLLDEERRLGARAAEAARAGQLRDGVGVAAQVASGDGDPRSRPPHMATSRSTRPSSAARSRGCAAAGPEARNPWSSIAVECRGSRSGRSPPGPRCRRRPAPPCTASSPPTSRPARSLLTDGWPPYKALDRLGYGHEPVSIRATTETASEPLPAGPPDSRRLLKRWLLATHQGAVQPEQLDYYLDEFTFRFNCRDSRAEARPSTDSSTKPCTPSPTPTNALVAAPPTREEAAGDHQAGKRRHKM